MNSNLFHNLINIAIALVGAVTAFLSAYGCTTLANGSLDCSASTLDPKWTGAIITILAIVKILVNVFRDGVSGLTKPQPPVSK